MAQLWRAQVSASVPIWGESNGAGAGSAPVITDITAAATSIVVTWSGAATHYRINGGATTALPDGTSPDTISGLTSNTEYNTPGLQLSGDGGSSWSAAVAFGTTNPGTGGGEINPAYPLQASALTGAGQLGSVAMSYTPPGAGSYNLQASPLTGAGQMASVAMSYTAPGGIVSPPRRRVHLSFPPPRIGGLRSLGGD